MIRRGVYKGPLVMNWVAIGGGMDAPNIYNLANFVRATPDGAMLTLESSMLNVLPVNMMAIAMGCTCAAASRTTSGRRIARPR